MTALRSKVRQTLRAVSVPVSLSAGDALPTEFRLFLSGWNETSKGRFLFDPAAAQSVMEAYNEWGVDLMIDLEHQALDAYTPPEATARDARGWFQLEVRPDGSLWAVNVRWTPDGAARLSEKRQRYISPAFSADPETGRVTSIINAAIVAMPATHETPALVAASHGEKMDPKLLKDAMDALIAGDAEKCMEILKGIIASAAGAESSEPPGEEAPPVEMAADPAPPPPDEKKEEVMAASARLLVLTGSRTFSGALDEIETWQRSHIKLEARQKELDAQQAALELGKRKENAAMLVKLGAETPATSGLNEGKLCKRLLDEPLAEQTKRVDLLLASRGTDRAKAEIALKAPGTAAREANGTYGDGSKEFKTPLGLVTLSASEIQACEDVGAKPEDFAHNKAIRAKSRGTKG